MDMILDFDPSRHSWPNRIPEGTVRGFVSALMTSNHVERLGGAGGVAGAEEVKSHPWFRFLSWENIKNQTMLSPLLKHNMSREFLAEISCSYNESDEFNNLDDGSKPWKFARSFIDF
jgi:hypothetical protein